MSGDSSPDIFGEILAGRSPCHKVWEDDVALAFLDIFPQTRGHTLVVPKIGDARGLLDFDSRELGPFMTAVQTVGIGLVGALAADGLEVMQLNGAAAGQTVFRLHVHLLPRWQNVPLLSHGATKRADDAALAGLADDICAKWRHCSGVW